MEKCWRKSFVIIFFLFFLSSFLSRLTFLLPEMFHFCFVGMYDFIRFVSGFLCSFKGFKYLFFPFFSLSCNSSWRKLFPFNRKDEVWETLCCTLYSYLFVYSIWKDRRCREYPLLVWTFHNEFHLQQDLNILRTLNKQCLHYPFCIHLIPDLLENLIFFV